MLAGVVSIVESLTCVPYLVAHLVNRSIQMAQPPDFGAASRCRIEFSMTRSESVTMVVDGSLERSLWRTPFAHDSPATSTNRGLSRLPMSLSNESSRKLPDRRSK